MNFPASNIQSYIEYMDTYVVNICVSFFALGYAFWGMIVKVIGHKVNKLEVLPFCLERPSGRQADSQRDGQCVFGFHFILISQYA